MEGLRVALLRAELRTASKCVRQGAAIDILEFSANRDTMGDAGRIDAALSGYLADVMCSCITFDGCTGR